MEFPVLFTTTKTGKTRKWKIWVESNKIWRTDGEINGKMKEPVCREVQKNTLRSADEQALLEAQKYWIQQLDKNYKPDPKDKKGMSVYNHVMDQKSKNGGMNRGVVMYGETHIKAETTSGKKDMSVHRFPMLAKKYLEHPEKVKFPALVQPKLDGVRCIVYLNDDQVVLESRGGKDYVFLNHIRKELKPILKTGVTLDGELYFHDDSMKNVERFQFLSQACKITRKKPHPEEHKVEYWIFDVYDLKRNNQLRFQMLNIILSDYSGESIKLTPTFTVKSHEEIEEKMQTFLKQDYEGLMIRNCEAVYVSKKGYHCDDLLKYKNFEDEEWVIVGAEPCQGTQKGAIKWKLEKENKSLVAKQMGSVEESRRLYEEYLEDPYKFIGLHINIRFNDRTKDGIPRFPRAVSFVHDKV